MRRAGWIAVAAALLAGCAVVPVAPPPAALRDASQLQDWTASGRLALAVRGEGGSGSFTWEQREIATTLSIRGPLGAGAMRVTTDGRALTVVDSDGRALDTAQAQSLLRQRLGADLPLGDLRYWMLGVPSPGAPSRVADSPDPPRRVIEQSGWRIGYDSFGATGGMALPSRFTASQGDLRLKVVVDEWRVAEPPEGTP